MSSAKYCFDTNALIQPWANRYPIDMFPDFWTNLEALIQDGVISSPDAVLEELSKIDDGLLEWAKRNQSLFHPLTLEIQKVIREILSNKDYQRLIDTRKNRSMADPFIIAQAKVYGLVVVTEEQFDTKRKHVRIPDVCRAMNIEFDSVLGFMRRENMKFVRS